MKKEIEKFIIHFADLTEDYENKLEEISEDFKDGNENCRQEISRLEQTCANVSDQTQRNHGGLCLSDTHA